MSYQTLEFIFFCILVVYIFKYVPFALRPVILIAANLIWAWSWNSWWALLPVVLYFINWGVIFLLEDGKLIGKDICYFGLIGLNLLVLVFLRTSLPSEFPNLVIYGSSFFIMMLIGLVIDVRRGHLKEVSISDGLLMTTFFPLMMNGPIERGTHFIPQVEKGLNFRWSQVRDGLLIFFYGYFKYELIGRPMTPLLESFFGRSGLSFFALFVGGIIGTFAIYVNFSSYCDMGRGVARCFGLDMSINFRPFYYAKSPVDFWTRWNISIGTWMRDYLIMPFLLKLGKKSGMYPLVFLSFVLIGLWHGFSWNWLAFGIFNGLLVALSIRTQRWGKVCGIFLCIILIAGNGILSQEEALIYLQGFIERPSWSFGPLAYFAVNFLKSPVLLVSVLMLFVSEFFQERSQAFDYYLNWTNQIKIILLVTVILFLVIYFNDKSWFADTPVPSLYFHL